MINNKPKLINKQKSGYFSIYNDVIYYSNLDDNSRLYSMNIDGTNNSLICNDNCDNIIIYNKTIYYTNKNHYLCSINLDGSNNRIIYNWPFITPFIYDGVVYYTEGSHGQLYSVSLHENNNKAIYHESYTYILFIYDKKLYFRDTNSNNYCMDLNTMSVSPCNLNANAATTYNNKIYYLDKVNAYLHSTNLDFTDDKFLLDKICCNMVIYNDLIYYEDQSTSNLYSLSLKSIPTISDSDKNLGCKNREFTINYQIYDSDNDELTITESLNKTTIKTLNNAPKNTDLIIQITDEMLYKLPLNQENKICIEVDNGKGGVTYRNYTFKRTNTAPKISGEDKDLNLATKDISQKYTVTDAENNQITVIENVDDTVIKTFVAKPNKEYVLAIPLKLWVTLGNGQHKLTVNATDSNNATSIRTYTFIKKENKIILDLKKAFETDAKANKILITPVLQGIENANVKVEVCNNALDTNVTWEDCTKEVLANQKYEFKNTSKTGEKWGINIKFIIERKDGTTEGIYFNGFGGAFE